MVSVDFAMRSTTLSRFTASFGLAFVCVIVLCLPVLAQQLSKRLILKDGSYQLATKWEIKGERVRYLSAERNEWEEVPNSMVDWPATDKFEKDRVAGVPSPEAVALDKELEDERIADEAKRPQVAPGLRLPYDNAIFLLDTFQNQPQLVELPQNNGEVNADRKGNILRSAINPVAGNKQTVELHGLHSSVQSHALLPAIYVNVTPDLGDINLSEKPPTPASKTPAELSWDRFHIVRAQPKQDKRVVGDIKIAILGKMTQEQRIVPTTAEKLTGGWVKITPKDPLSPGEYAVVELLDKGEMNLFVWDFGVNPSANSNAQVIKPDIPAIEKPNDHPVELKGRANSTPVPPKP
jgi:hypothetical protein